jgi:hypothetical protein
MRVYGVYYPAMACTCRTTSHIPPSPARLTSHSHSLEASTSQPRCWSLLSLVIPSPVTIEILTELAGQRARQTLRHKSSHVRWQCRLACSMDRRIICILIRGVVLHSGCLDWHCWGADLVASRSHCCAVVRKFDISTNPNSFHFSTVTMYLVC